MSDLIAIFAAVVAPLALPIDAAAPVVAACVLFAAWRSAEHESAARSQATHQAVERSRTVLGALSKQ